MSNLTGFSMKSILGFFLFGLCVVGGSSVWDDIGSALVESPATFHQVVDPIVDMHYLTYVSTTGSYYKEGSKAWSVHGFDREYGLSVDQPVDKGGMRAIVFVDQEESGPVIIAYRGTDTNASTPGGQADLCFDYIMAGLPPPKFCDNFTPSELDYFTQAKEVVTSTQEKYPERSIVLTGHSLGCALTGMMSVEFSATTVGVCFSLPISLQYTASRTGMNTEDVLELENLHVLTDSNDPINVEAVIFDGFFGQLYIWETPGSEDCCSCCEVLHSGTSAGVLADPACSDCFGTRHTLGNYIDLAEQSNVMAVLTPDPEVLAECVCPQTSPVLKKGAHYLSLDQ